MVNNLDITEVLDAIGHGILLFSSDGSLVSSNVMAGTMLGKDLNIIKQQGWTAAVAMFDSSLQSMDWRMESIRARAMETDRPVRFKIFRSGLYVPCWAAAVNASDGEVYVMLTMDLPDWELVASVLDRFRGEMQDAIDSTVGHIKLINRTLQLADDDDDDDVQSVATARVGRRISGFTRLIEVHMSRADRLIGMLQRLQDVRTGDLRDKVNNQRRKINFEDFMEDFLESLDEFPLLDPESEKQDYRSRIRVNVRDFTHLNATPYHLTTILRELLRNALMYSMVGTPVMVNATAKNEIVQIDIVDEGYGIREKERNRVFEPFERARQPQIISEFGYGLALHLCRYEVEGMNGQLWFSSEESVGTTFSLTLPLWREDSESSSRL